MKKNPSKFKTGNYTFIRTRIKNSSLEGGVEQSETEGWSFKHPSRPAVGLPSRGELVYSKIYILTLIKDCEYDFFTY